MPWTKSHKSWHKSLELVEQLEKFADKYARVPDMSPVKELETNLLRDLRDHMKTLPGWDIREFQYTGSVYENLKIGKPDEFDIMVIMRGKGIKDESCYQSGYRYLVPDSTTDSHTKSLDSKGHISPTKLQSNFFSTVVKSVNHLSLSDSIKPRMHGPAVQLDVTNQGHFFQIDVVPAFDVGGKLYVAKPHPGKPASWRVSTSLQEKAKLTGIDRDNGCRRMVVRILKAICQKDPTFKVVSSFHYKNAMFHVMDKHKSWTREELGERVIDVMKYLHDGLEKKSMPNYFNDNINILDGINKQACMGACCRMTSLQGSKTKFSKLIST